MKKITRIFIAVLCIMMLAGMIPAYAATAPYKTYTYSMYGVSMYSPDAYVPDRMLTNYEMGISTSLSGPKDIFVDDDGNIYISDTGNGRVLVCNSEFKYQFEISSFVNEHGVQDALSKPQGLFVTSDTIYVCDTDNARIVLFDLSGNFQRIIYAPEADVMGEDTMFHPVALSVDKSGRMYIVSDQTYSGIFSINEDGTFQGFIGAQKAEVPLATRIRRLIFPEVVSESFITSAYNNIAIDAEGFVYVTTNDIDETTLANAIRSGNSDYAPVKRLNIQGDDIMTRNGFFIPAGEVDFQDKAIGGSSSAATGPSSIIDVALGENGMWAIIDSKRSRIYTYDSEGNLLFAFGDKGAQLGNLKQPTAITFSGSDIYVLDSTMNSVTVYKRTEYGDIINQALYHSNTREYSKALTDWEEILKRNNNFDAAYVGIGTNLYRQGEYKSSLVYFKAAGDTASYSDSFKAIRKAWTEKYVVIAIIVLVVILVLLAKFLKYVGKKNKEGSVKVEKRTLWEEIIYAFYLIVHPFDGFWDLKHEKRGSVRGALVIDACVIISYVYYIVGRAYIFNPNKSNVHVFSAILTIIVPLMLWCVSNWCLTTLFDGEGNFKDIFISSSYSLFPLFLFFIPI
ncbi:MAG: YIP1 family protein, partial [Eubacteriales bacterium]